MQPLAALFFPRTHLTGSLVRELLLFFPKVLSYQSCERSELKAPQDVLQAAGWYKSYPPAPMGEDLLRFQRTIRDLKEHKEEYYGAYMTALAAQGLGDHGDERSTWSLRAQMASKVTAETAKEGQDLWNARIFLRLAEIYDQEEMEVARVMQDVAVGEQTLADLLQGEEFDDGEPLDIPALSSRDMEQPPGPLSNLRQRLRHWGALFREDRSLPWPIILVTDQAEALATLTESRLKNFPERGPRKLFDLTIPLLPDELDDREFLRLCTALRVTAADVLKRTTEFLHGVVNGTAPGVGIAMGAEACQSDMALYEQTVRTLFQVGAGSCRRLTFHHFAGIAAFDLLAEGFAPVVDKDASGTEATPGAVIALLE